MSTRPISTFLRRALLIDLVATSATAALLVLGADSLAGLLGLPAMLLRIAGLIVIPFLALVAWAATRITVVPQAIWAIVVCNVLWVVASIVLLVSGWVAPSALGYAFVIAQALAVGLFAELQVMALRRTGTVAA